METIIRHCQPGTTPEILKAILRSYWKTDHKDYVFAERRLEDLAVLLDIPKTRVVLGYNYFVAKDCAPEVLAKGQFRRVKGSAPVTGNPSHEEIVRALMFGNANRLRNFLQAGLNPNPA